MIFLLSNNKSVSIDLSQMVALDRRAAGRLHFLDLVAVEALGFVHCDVLVYKIVHFVVQVLRDLSAGLSTVAEQQEDHHSDEDQSYAHYVFPDAVGLRLRV